MFFLPIFYFGIGSQTPYTLSAKPILTHPLGVKEKRRMQKPAIGLPRVFY